MPMGFNPNLAAALPAVRAHHRVLLHAHVHPSCPHYGAHRTASTQAGIQDNVLNKVFAAARAAQALP